MILTENCNSMKIILNKEKCICCGACQATCPKYFELEEDGKSHILGGKLNKETKNEELETVQLDCAKDAAESCPVQAIEILE